MSNQTRPLVSVISPCYNGENYIHRYLESIIHQTYTQIELIIINDGSTDKTEEIISSYKHEIEEKGIHLIYLKQNNQGPSAAINQALLVFKGDYIAFVDSDDYLSDDAIEKKVTYMENYPEIGLLVNKIKVMDYESLAQTGTMERRCPEGRDHFFDDVISGNNVFYTPGGYFWRSVMFRDAMPNPLQIVAPREIGQNFQLLLPIAYKYPVGYIDEYLYYYIVRRESLSHSKHTYERAIKNWEVAKSVLTQIASDIENDSSKRMHIQDLIDTRCYREQMNISWNYGRKKEYKYYQDLWIHKQVGNNALRVFQLKTTHIFRKAFYDMKVRFSSITRSFQTKI